MNDFILKGLVALLFVLFILLPFGKTIVIQLFAFTVTKIFQENNASVHISWSINIRFAKAGVK